MIPDNIELQENHVVVGDELIPVMIRIFVDPHSLILDPNNPRLISRAGDRVGEAAFLQPGVIEETHQKMMGTGQDRFKIADLKSSIIKNGWQPVDLIFVRRHAGTDSYIVLEGNRRITAIRSLLQDEETPHEIKAQIQRIEVMEIVEELEPAELEKKVSYLLGVRHHGSLKQWSPFAQAHNIFKQFLSILGLSEENFQWNDSVGERIAHKLGIKPALVKERLRVYRAMRQIGNQPDIKASETEGAGIKDRYYSIFQEVTKPGSGKINQYIEQDQDTFLLDEVSTERMINLCHFDRPGRRDSPINNPQQWRYLNDILSDENEDKSAAMLREVEVDRHRPEIVWAKRAEELRKLQWDKWLDKVAKVISRVSLGNIQLLEDESEVVERLVNVLSELDHQAPTEEVE